MTPLAAFAAIIRKWLSRAAAAFLHAARNPLWKAAGYGAAAQVHLARLLWKPGPASPDFDPASARRVLAIRTDEIGDVVMTGPFLRELRRQMPAARITLVVKPQARSLVELCPYVDEVLEYDTSAALWQRPFRLPWRAYRMAQRDLRPRLFDLALLPRRDADGCYATFLAHFSGAPLRAGYSERATERKALLNRGFDRLLTHAILPVWSRHEVESNLELLGSLRGENADRRLELWIGDADRAFADRLLAGDPENPRDPLVAIWPSGGHSPLKQWLLARFAELSRWLRKEWGARILLVGGPGEEAQGQAIAREMGGAAIDATGRTTLRQMAALLERCALAIGGDAGPMHVAAAMRVPVIALFGSSCPHRFGPWGDGHTVIWSEMPCGPCAAGHSRDRCRRCPHGRPLCMESIAVVRVQEAARDILQRRELAAALVPYGSNLVRFAQEIPRHT